MTQPIAEQPRPFTECEGKFSLRGAQRTRDAVVYVEQNLIRGGSPLPPSGGLPGSNPGMFAQTTSSISPASGLLLGSGTAQLCSLSGTTLTVDGDDITVLNMIAMTIPNNTIVAVGWINGSWVIVVAPC